MTVLRPDLPPIPSLRDSLMYRTAVDLLVKHQPVGQGRCSCGAANCRAGLNASATIRAAAVDPLVYLQPATANRPLPARVTRAAAPSQADAPQPARAADRTGVPVPQRAAQEVAWPSSAAPLPAASTSACSRPETSMPGTHNQGRWS